MRKYDEVQELLKRLRSGEPCLEASGNNDCNDCKMKDAASGCLCAMAADEIEALTAIMAKQQVIIRRIYAEHLPNTWFVCGEMGEKDQNGLPQYIDVCPAYGVGWYQVYEKTDRSVSTEGS